MCSPLLHRRHFWFRSQKKAAKYGRSAAISSVSVLGQRTEVHLVRKVQVHFTLQESNVLRITDVYVKFTDHCAELILPLTPLECCKPAVTMLFVIYAQQNFIVYRMIRLFSFHAFFFKGVSCKNTLFFLYCPLLQHPYSASARMLLSL